MWLCSPERHGSDQTFRARFLGGGAIFPLIDIQNNNTVALTDAGANVTGNVYYEPYGKTTESGATGLLEFTGRPQAVADLYYLRARYLDVRNGRFISEDPSGLAGGDPDLYRYAGANPIGAMDPQGLRVFSVGVSVNVQLGPVNLNGNVGLAVDTHGGVAITRTVGAGAGIGAEANASLSVSPFHRRHGEGSWRAIHQFQRGRWRRGHRQRRWKRVHQRAGTSNA